MLPSSPEPECSIKDFPDITLVINCKPPIMYVKHESQTGVPKEALESGDYGRHRKCKK